MAFGLAFTNPEYNSAFEAGDKRRKAIPIPVNATKPFPNQDSSTRYG
jgi:hypothetical protein